MLEGFSPVPIDNFRGVYFRGVFPEEVPPNFAFNAANLVFDGANVRRRKGITSHVTYNGAVGTAVRLHVYNKADGVRFLLMDNLGKIFDITAGGATPILDFPSSSDFSVLTMFDRAYITPHDRSTGLGSEFLYVYDGTTARAAAGTKPSTTLTAATGAAGSVSIGVHIISFAFETDTGFITKYATPISYTAPGAAKIDLTSVDVGPSGTVKRHILISKAISGYNGNVNAYELFFVDTINDNSTTTKTIDFFDSALVSSGKYLLDQLETIPAGVFLCEHEGSLVIGGENGVTAPVAGVDITVLPTLNDPNAKPRVDPSRSPAVPVVNPTGSSIARVSKSGNPESFNAVSGWVAINPDGGGLKNGRSYRGSLYLFKSARTHVTWDNGGEPSTWPHQEIDGGQGTECFGIAELNTSKGFTQNTIIILNKNGLWAFDGSYSAKPLSWSIEKAIYDSIGQSSWFTSNAEVMISAVDKLIYVNMQISVTRDGLSSILWIGDYGKGLDSENIRWIPWQFKLSGPITPTLNSIKIVDDVIYIATDDSNKLWKTSVLNDDDGVSIYHYIDFNIPLPPTGAVYKLAGAILAIGSDNGTDITATVFDINASGQSFILPTISGTTNRIKYFFVPIDVESEVIRIKIESPSTFYFTLYRVIAYVKQVWAIRPL